MLAPQIPKPEQGASPLDYFNWAEELARIRSSIQSLEHWDQIETQTIAPHANQVFQLLTRYFAGKKEEAQIWESWRDRYVPELISLLKIMRMEAAQKSARRLSEIRQIIDPCLPESKQEEPFSRKALWAVASTPGVSCVLNGIRHPLYVDDSLTILQWELLSQPQALFQAIQTINHTS